MTPRERELLEVLATQDGFKSLPWIQYYSEALKAYTRQQLVHSIAKLVKLGFAVRTVANPERETKYKITELGTESLLAKARTKANLRTK